MASGIHGSCNRPKTAKNLRSAKGKTFKNNSEAAQAAYRAKLALRASRKLKKKRK